MQYEFAKTVSIRAPARGATFTRRPRLNSRALGRNLWGLDFHFTDQAPDPKPNSPYPIATHWERS